MLVVAQVKSILAINNDVDVIYNMHAQNNTAHKKHGKGRFTTGEVTFALVFVGGYLSCVNVDDDGDVIVIGKFILH